MVNNPRLCLCVSLLAFFTDQAWAPSTVKGLHLHSAVSCPSGILGQLGGATSSVNYNLEMCWWASACKWCRSQFLSLCRDSTAQRRPTEYMFSPWYLQQYSGVCTKLSSSAIILSLQKKKLKLREVKLFAYIHPICKWESRFEFRTMRLLSKHFHFKLLKIVK